MKLNIETGKVKITLELEEGAGVEVAADEGNPESTPPEIEKKRIYQREYYRKRHPGCKRRKIKETPQERGRRKDEDDEQDIDYKKKKDLDRIAKERGL